MNNRCVILGIVKKKDPSPSSSEGCAAISHWGFSVCVPRYTCHFLFLCKVCFPAGAFGLTAVLLFCSCYCWFSGSSKCVRNFSIGMIKVNHIKLFHIRLCLIVLYSILIYPIVLYCVVLFGVLLSFVIVWQLKSKGGAVFLKPCYLQSTLKRLCLMVVLQILLFESGMLKRCQLPVMTSACFTRWGERRLGSGQVLTVALRWT